KNDRARARGLSNDVTTGALNPPALSAYRRTTMVEKIVLPPPHEKTGPSKRDLQREETRHKLYEAALEVFRRDGVAAARIDDITRAVGTSRGTFYFHFPTKEHVLVERM